MIKWTLYDQVKVTLHVRPLVLRNCRYKAECAVQWVWSD